MKDMNLNCLLHVFHFLHVFLSKILLFKTGSRQHTRPLPYSRLMEPKFEVLPPGPPRPQKSFFQNLWGWGVAGVIAIVKFKFLIFGALKISLSMLLMIWVYSWMFGWQFAAGLVFLLFVHEMGHVTAAKWLGI